MPFKYMSWWSGDLSRPKGAAASAQMLERKQTEKTPWVLEDTFPAWRPRAAGGASFQELAELRGAEPNIVLASFRDWGTTSNVSYLGFFCCFHNSDGEKCSL